MGTVVAAIFSHSRAAPGGFSHYGAMGAEKWNWRGEQFGRYEAAIGTGQSIFYFASGTSGNRA